MIEVSQCVICDGAIEKLKRALVAPFVARRIWNRAPFCVDLVRCKACTFIFYDLRLDDDLQELYKNYRDHEYRRARHASKPPRNAGRRSDGHSFDVDAIGRCFKPCLQKSK